MTPDLILKRAAFIAGQYDPRAADVVTLNRTDRFHLCGLIERAATVPKSGAVNRRLAATREAVAEAKAIFCHANGVVHPVLWEWFWKPVAPCEEVRAALMRAARLAAKI